MFYPPELLFLIPSSYILLELYFVERFFNAAGEKDKADNFPPISIIKPVKGLDPHFEEAVKSFAVQDYPEFEIIISASTYDNDLIKAAKRILDSPSGKHISLVLSDDEHGSNGKVSRIINAFSSAKHDIIIISDADVRIPQGYLSLISKCFADENIGMVTSLYIGACASTYPSKLELYGYLSDMIPKVITARHLQGLKFGLGAFMATRRSALEGIGGFASIADYLADDYQLGHLISQNGWKIEIPDKPVEILQGNDSFLNMMRRQIRWGRTIRVSRPLGFAGSFITVHIFWLIFIPALSGFTLESLGAAACYYLIRFISSFFMTARHFDTFINPLTLFIRDLMTAVVWICSWSSNYVYWRGERYRVHGDGKMERLQ